MHNLQIASTAIKELDGLYSLNDLHHASGGINHHRPSKFISNEQTQALIAEIELSPNSGLALKILKGGRNPGTYACKELVYAYAMWISPKFNLLVIRAFDAMQQAQQPKPKVSQFTVSGIEHLALQDQVSRLQQELLDAYRDKITTLEAGRKVRKVRRSVATTTVDMDKQRFEGFAMRVKAALKPHQTLNKGQLLAECGYAKDDKTARKLLDEGTNTHWFCVKQGGVYTYSLSAEGLAGGAL